MGIVWLGAAELIVRYAGPKRSVGKVLQLATSTVVTDKNMKLAIGSEPDYATVMIAALDRIGGILLKCVEPDDIPIQRQGRTIPSEAVHSVSEQGSLAEHRVSLPVVLSVQYRETPGLVGKAGCSAIPKPPRSEPKLTGKSSTVLFIVPFITRCTFPVSFSSTRMSSSPRNAMVVGLLRPLTTVLTSNLGSTTVGCASTPSLLTNMI